MDKNDILSTLQQNVTADGTSQFNFSKDLATKKFEQKMLEILETEGCIRRLTIALGYAIYRLF